MAKRSVLRQRDFRLLWSSQTISEFGTMIDTAVALPLLAVTVLGASPAQMGLLSAADTAAFLVIGLPVGVWVDRLRRRPIMIAADVARAVLLASIPLAWCWGVLGFGQLIVVGLLCGACQVFFDVAYQSFLPAVVARDRLSDGNAALGASMSTAHVAGPAVGGVIVQALGAALTIAADAVSFVGSAALVLRIRAAEPRPRHTERRLWAEIGAGLRFVAGEPMLRAITACTATANLFGGITSALHVLFLSRVVGLSPGVVGGIVAAGGFGGVLAAVSSGWWHRRVGQTRTIWLSMLVTTPFTLLVPFTGAGLGLWAAVLGELAFGYGVVLYNVAQLSLRQALCPDHLLGRMNATVRFVVFGVTPLGALVGGFLAEAIGVRGALWISEGGMVLAVGWLLCSPIVRLRADRPRPVSARA